MKQVFVTYVGFSLSKKESYTLDYGTIRQELEKYPKVDLKTLRQVIIVFVKVNCLIRKYWVMPVASL